MKFGYGCYAGRGYQCQVEAKKLREIDILLDGMSRCNMSKKIKEIRRIISSGG